jgi:pimeloyl-ACP methyl ester carboxylesterase
LVADILSDEYKVITYDRRGNSRSTRNEPQNFEMSQQSRDALAVIKAAGEESAFVFGNSGGAVIALDMAKTQPQAVRAAIVHEAPVSRMHPDGKHGSAFSRRFTGLVRPLARHWRCWGLRCRPAFHEALITVFRKIPPNASARTTISS